MKHYLRSLFLLVSLVFVSVASVAAETPLPDVAGEASQLETVDDTAPSQSEANDTVSPQPEAADASSQSDDDSASTLSEAANDPLRPKTLSLFTDEGLALLLAEEVDKRPYVKLSSHFVTQKTRAFCSVASAVMVLNALGGEAPFDPIYAPYATFTQSNFFTENTWRVVSPLRVSGYGMSLQQAGEAIAAHYVQVKGSYAADTTLEKFREEARSAISSGQYVIVNFQRARVGQEGGGHFSPLAAYNAKADRFLVLDVARFRYAPFWVSTEDLWGSMSAVDDYSDSSRGYLIVSKLSSSVKPARQEAR